MDDFTILIERIQALTGLSQRDAAKVAFELDEYDIPAAVDIIDKAEAMGFEVNNNKAELPSEPERIPEVTFDPARVLTEVYMKEPRAMCREFPMMGKAPTELQEHIDELDLPDEVKALLVKVDLLEGQATIWLWDEANQVDRPIGPLDLTSYNSANALHEALSVLAKRLPLVLRADYN